MGRGKVALVQAMKSPRGNTHTAIIPLNLSTRWITVVNFIPWPLYPCYQMSRRLGGPQNQTNMFHKKKKIPASFKPTTSSPQPSHYTRYPSSKISNGVVIHFSPALTAKSVSTILLNLWLDH